MEKVPEENLHNVPEQGFSTADLDTNEISSESMEPKIDHWEMVKVMSEFGFTDINEHPEIMNDPRLKEMRGQDFMYGSYENSKGETVTTIWKDGYCWARKGNHPQLDKIEEKIGRTLRRGAIQPNNLVFEHSDLG